MLFNRLEQQQQIVWLPTTIDLFQQIRVQSRASTEALSTTTQRHTDAAEGLSSANFRVSSDYSSDKEETDADGGQSMLGLQSYWDVAYSDELSNFREHGHTGEVWFGDDVMEIVTSWTKDLCVEISKKEMSVSDNGEVNDQADKYLSSWNVLDLGTGNGLLLHQLAKEG
ncbi:unnamed protein product, partial [Eruca vesicaria subsp. sativa]|nr:unnamed protein product [Eruca vesicaria subsp. sativa]